MARKGGFGKVESGSNVEGYGAKKGRTGLDPRFNSGIKDDVFSSDWNSPLNMGNSDDPLPDPWDGAIISEGANALGTPPNPLGIENLSTSEKPARTSSIGRSRSGRGR
jgi:hypothetical protein